MLRSIGIGCVLLGVLWTAGMAASETGFALSGGGSLDIYESGGFWLASAALTSLMWVVDRRAALMTISGVGAVIALGVFMVASGGDHASPFVVFGATAFVLAVVSATVLIRADRRAARQSNPLRDVATEFFDDPPIFETGGVQYLAVLDAQDSPPALRVRVLLQNCHDTPATARVRFEEDAVGEPSVDSPELEPVEIDAEGWSLLEWQCPARRGHRGEGWFHLSVKVQRDNRGRRTRLWRTQTGPSGLKATQLLHGLAPRRSQYSGETVALPKVGEEPALAHCSKRAVVQAELESLLRDHA